MTSPVPEIRVLVAVPPRLRKERILPQLESHPGVNVVGCTTRPSETLVMAGELLADVVLLTGEEDDTIPGICTHLLYELPKIVVVAITPDGEHATVFRQTTTAEKLEGSLEQGLKRIFDGIRPPDHSRNEGEPSP